jgi:hypothetical protein
MIFLIRQIKIFYRVLNAQVSLCSLIYLLREITGCARCAALGERETEHVEYGVRMYQLYRQIKCNVIGINI